MSIARALPYLLLAAVLGAAGYLAGAVSDPFAPAQTSVRGDLSPQEPRLRQALQAARGEAAELTGELQRAQATIDRLRAEVTQTRSRIADLQQRAEDAEQARAAAETRIGELAERVAALEARAGDGAVRSRADGTDGPTAEPEPTATASAAPDDNATGDNAAGDNAGGDSAAGERDAAGTDDPSEPTAATSPDDGPASPAGAANAPNPETAGGGTGGQPTAAATEATTAAPTAAVPTTAAPTAPADETDAEADQEIAGARTTAAAPTDAGPPGVDADPRPGSDALSAINPSPRQANRLVSGVQAYQDANYPEAFRTWLPLARAGYARAQLHLGALFLEGRGTARNDPLAFAWLTIAQENGSQNAGPLLDQLRDRMSGADMETARQLLSRARQTAGNAG